MSVTDYEIGDLVRWPNGTEGEVYGVDDSDGTLMDACGGWHDADEVELVA